MSEESAQPYDVRLVRDELVDASRDNRPINIKIYYPDNYEGEAKLPIIMWSHGLGGSVDGAAFLSRHISAHGYIMVHIQHHGTDVTLWQGKDEHPWDVMKKTEITRDMTLNRYRDVPYVLDHLDELFDKYPKVKQMADTNKIGMSGHSFGALTSQVMAGMLFPNEDDTLTSYYEPRFTAMIAYSPGDIAHLGGMNEAESYAAIKTPIFHMTGTEDRSPLTNKGYEIRFKAYNGSPEHPLKRLLVIDGADHMVFAGSRGKLGANKDREKHEEEIKSAALDYWNEVFY